MKRILIVLGFIAPMFLMGLPAANATVYAEKCQTWVGPSGNRAVQFCASLGSDGTDWWGRAEGHTVAGYGNIYSATGQLRYYSKDSSGNICWGDVSAGGSSCQGQGTWVGNLTPPNNHATQPHFGWTDHYCTSWSWLQVYWTYVQGGTQYSTTFESFHVATPPCAS